MIADDSATKLTGMRHIGIRECVYEDRMGRGAGRGMRQELIRWISRLGHGRDAVLASEREMERVYGPQKTKTGAGIAPGASLYSFPIR